MSMSMSEEYRPPRKVEYFESPQEVLGAVYDAISEHQRIWKSSGTIHGNINPDTLFIASSSAKSKERGFLKPLTFYDKTNHMFQSVMSLSRSVLCRSNVLPPDYLDDLESFYYIIAWFALAYTGPGGRLPQNDFPAVLARWAWNPCSRESVLEKEAMLFGTGFGFNNVSSFFGGYTLERLLQSLHSILRGRYCEKLSFGRVMTWEEMSKASEVAYADFLWEIRTTITILDDAERNRRTQALIISHGGLFPEDLDAMVESYKAMGCKFDEEEDW